MMRSETTFRINALAFALAAAALSVACGGSNPEPETPPPAAPTASTPDNASMPPGDGTGNDIHTGMGTGIGGMGGANGTEDRSIPEGIAGTSGEHPAH